MSSHKLHLTPLPAGPNGFFRSPVLVSDEENAILVDGGFTFTDGESVAKRILASGKKLTAIYISQGDPDYYFSLERIRKYFPDVPVISKQSILNAIQANVEKKISVWGPKLKENGPQSMDQIILPTVMNGHLNLNNSKDSETIEVVETSLTNRYYLWSDSLKAVFGGVLVFSDVHVWVADLPSSEQRSKWVEILNEIIARKPHIVVPGHMQLNSATDASSLIYTRDYLLALEEERAKAADSKALIQAMKNRYPAAGMEVALEIGAQVLMGEMKWDSPQTDSTKLTNLDLIKSTYQGKSENNKGKLPSLLHSDVEWIEAEGFPYAGTYHGPEQVIKNVFSRLASEWENYTAHGEEFISQGDIVIVFGFYTGTYKATGKSMRADFVHRYEMKDGRIIRMKQYVDSFVVRSAMI